MGVLLGEGEGWGGDVRGGEETWGAEPPRPAKLWGDLPEGERDEVDKTCAWLLWGLCDLIIHEFTRTERNHFVAWLLIISCGSYFYLSINVLLEFLFFFFISGGVCRLVCHLGCQARRERVWNVLMAGPVLSKISPSLLPWKKWGGIGLRIFAGLIHGCASR